MTPPDLIAFVRTQSQSGVSAQELRETLMGAGWNERDIENALHDVAAGLQPVTAGASIHEDLAQVRGLVAHLSARVKRLEGRLISTDPEHTLTEPQELRSGSLERSRSLPAPKLRWGMIVRVLIIAIVCAGIGSSLSGITPETASRSLQLVGVVAILFVLFGWFYIRHHRVWMAQICVASAVAIAAWSLWLGYHTYALFEWTTALGAGVLLVVYLFVASRWIGRIDR